MQDVNFTFSGGTGTNLWGRGQRAPEESEWLWSNLHVAPLSRLLRTLLINTPLVIFAFLFSTPTLLAAVNVDPNKVVESPAFSWLVKGLGSVDTNVAGSRPWLLS